MRRVLTIAFLLFMCLIFVCCESKTKARMRYEAEQQKRFEKQNKELRQWNFISMRKSRPGRYEIFQNQQFAKKIFLLDTMDGRVWTMVEGRETKELLWQEINVENRDTLSIEELFKNDK